MPNQKISVLPPGEHYFEDIINDWKKGRYHFAQARSASGRLNLIIGISPEQWAGLKTLAQKNRVGLAVVGSRAVGPRIRQRTLHPALKTTIPMEVNRRHASATYPEIKDTVITKTTIKEMGFDHPLTSDLGLFVIDPHRAPQEHEQIAATLETQIKQNLNISFPIRAYSSLNGCYFKTEKDVQAQGARFLKQSLTAANTFTDENLAQAYQELYIPLNLPRPWLQRRDWINALIVAATASISFSLALPYHPVITLVGFLFGLLGRYIARLKATIVFLGNDSIVSNTFALLVDACIGILAMAGLINPIAGYGISLNKIIVNSLGHTLSRGSLRLVVDKLVYNKTSHAQANGVVFNTLFSLLQGLVTSYVYAGNYLAYSAQTITGLIGVGLLFQIPIKKFFSKELQSFHRK